MDVVSSMIVVVVRRSSSSLVAIVTGSRKPIVGQEWMFFQGDPDAFCCFYTDTWDVVVEAVPDWRGVLKVSDCLFKSQCVTIVVPSAWVTLTLLWLLPKEEALRTENGGGRGAQKSGRSETFENGV